MQYVLNLHTKSLSPIATHEHADPQEFVVKDALIVTKEEAQEITSVPVEEREPLILALLQRRMLNHKELPEGAKTMLYAYLNKQVFEKAKEEADAEAESPTFETRIKPNKAQVSQKKIEKMSQGELVRYAREILGMEDVKGNEPAILLRERVIAEQFGQKEDSVLM